MQEYTFRDELLNLPEAKKYQLSIQISLDGFVVFIHEGVKHQTISPRNGYAEQLQNGDAEARSVFNSPTAFGIGV